ncbi:MAG TPA: geranylgeranyl reductase family protein [Candidatus Korarchaeota archaeon]|nr:geranylgeranyl reductase family protein [Candidatus Korarchaeota archaeon]
MYDVLIVGCGPAGALLASLASMKGFKVLIVERKVQIEQPTICGEFLPDFSLIRRVFPEDFHSAAEFLRKFFYSKEYILNETKEVVIDFNGKVKWLKLEGKVISRKKVVSQLIKVAKDYGTELLLSTSYLGSKISSNGEIVSLLRGKKEFLVNSRIVVGADGFPSRVSRSMGLNNEVKGEDLAYVTVQLAKGVHPESSVYMGFYKNISPGGYAWIIPRGNSYFGVGVGARSSYRVNIRHCHEIFLRKVGLKSSGQIYGKALPVGGIFGNLANDFSLLVGDAAGLVMPVNGGGIPTAAVSSFIASEALESWFEEPKNASDQFRRSMIKCFENTFNVALRARKIVDLLTKHDLVPILWMIPSSILRGVIALDKSSLGYKLLDFF